MNARPQRNAWRNAMYPVAAIVILLVLWEAAVFVFRVPPYLLPAPSRVFAEIWNNGAVLLRHGRATLTIILVAFACSTCLGIPLALAISFSPIFAHASAR
jgi:NitT/TauT family transport system permease protein